MEPKYSASLDDHKPLRNLVVKMFGKVYRLNPATDLALHPSTLGEDIQKQPSLYAFYATVRDMAVAKVEALQAQLEQVRSVLDQQYRTDGELPGGGKITEDGIRRQLRADPTVAKAMEKVHNAQFQANLLGSIVRAFEHKRDCLIAAGQRANNSTWHDSDVDISVSASISDIPDSARKMGQHPSKEHVN